MIIGELEQAALVAYSLASSSLALYFGFRRQRIRARKEEGELTAEERKAEHDESNRSRKERDEAESRVIAQYKEFLAARERRYNAELERLRAELKESQAWTEKELEEKERALDEVRRREQECRQTAAGQETEIRYLREAVALLREEVKTLRTDFGLGDRRRGPDPGYRGPERRHPDPPEPGHH